MKKSKNKKFFTLALILLTTIFTMVFSIPVGKGQVEVATYPYLVVTPNPVGLDQKVFLVMWIHGTPPTSAGLGGDRYRFTIEVKKPNENNFNFIYPDPNNPVNKYFI
jgi:dipeptidyl aminopeptidase/acylaminoacyl peptidase